MAEGENVTIKIVATGGDEAAAEVRKVDAAITGESVTIGKLEKNLREARAAYKAAEVGSDEFAAASKRLESAQSSLAATTGKVTAKGVQMGTGWQNVGYQMQDLAVQVGSGTSAFRALGQQLPQLLSGFGPMGIMLGTVSAVALPLAGAMFSLGESTSKAGTDAAEAAEKLEKLRDKAKAIAGLKSSEGLKKFIEGLDDEEQAITRQNDALGRQIELLKARRTAMAETEAAKREAEIAKIEADPNKSDADKIREVAAVNERGAKAELESKLHKLSSDMRDAAVETAGAEKTSADAARQATAMAEKQAALEKEKKELRIKVEASKSGESTAKGLRSKIAELDAKEAAGSVPTMGGAPTRDPKAAAKSKLLRADLEKQLSEAIVRSGSASQDDRARLANIGPEIATAKSAAENERMAAAEAARKVGDAKAKEAQMGELQKIQAPEILSQFNSRSAARNATSEAAAKKAEAAADKEKKDKGDADKRRKDDEDAKAKKERSQDDIKGREAGLNRDSSRAAARFGENAGKLKGGKLKDDLSGISKSLEDGTNEKELAALSEKFKAATEGMGGAIIENMSKMLAALDVQAKQIAVLGGQIKNNRSR